MKSLFSSLFFLALTNIYSQYLDEAIGTIPVVEVYEFTDINSKVVYEIKNNQMFFINESDYENEEWLEIKLNIDKLSKTNENIKGYVLRKNVLRIKELDSLNKIPIVLNFDLVEKNINNVDGVSTIYYGLENDKSKTIHIENMFLYCNSYKIEITPLYYEDLFNIFTEPILYTSENYLSFRFYKHNDCYIIVQKCNDGAGSYKIAWVIEKCTITQRLISDL